MGVSGRRGMPQEARNFYIETLGCQMNIYDSEIISGMLQADGWAQAQDPTTADLILINTCSVRDRAERKARSMAAEFASLRRTRPALMIGLMGCMAQRLGEKLLDDGTVNLVVGTDCYDYFIELLHKAEATGKPVVETGHNYGCTYALNPRAHSSVKAFVSVMRGCDNFCSYCIVPYVRGRERSKDRSEIIREIRRLVDLGVKEVTLLGQNVNSYRDGDIDFPGLLTRIDGIAGLARIRFTTSHPKDLTDGLISAMRDLPKVCEHLHLPIQSGSDRILRLMNRGYTYARYKERHDSARAAIPGLAVTTDFLVGFPGESEEEYGDTLKAARDLRFDAAFMFRYSAREGTDAQRLPDDVPEGVKLDRLKGLIALQNAITDRRKQALMGRSVEVLVEGPGRKEPDYMLGRTRENWLAKIPSKGVRQGSTVDAQVTSVTRWMITCSGVKVRTEA
jgi:tRNA-2-methylthio-N6-dimethylallyladenosine synthase